jgi:hypothetical protein
VQRLRLVQEQPDKRCPPTSVRLATNHLDPTEADTGRRWLLPNGRCKRQERVAAGGNIGHGLILNEPRFPRRTPAACGYFSCLQSARASALSSEFRSTCGVPILRA